MTLEAKGRIRFNPDVKPGEPQYAMEAKQLGVYSEGSGDLEQMIDELTERVRRAISEEFCVAPSLVQIVGYSMGITFAVDGPVNKTLDDFQGAAEDLVKDSSEITMQFAGHEPITVSQEHIDLAKKTLELSKQTGIPPETIIKMAKAKAAKGKE